MLELRYSYDGVLLHSSVTLIMQIPDATSLTSTADLITFFTKQLMAEADQVVDNSFN